MKNRLNTWWMAPAPPQRLAALRILIGGYALVYMIVRLPELVAVARLPEAQFEPVGVVRMLGGPWPVGVVIAVAITTCLALVAFVIGAGYRYVAPVAAAG